MAKPFHELWKAMEEWRRGDEAGEVSPPHRFQRRYGVGRRRRGCPDEESLCGWTDGWLFRSNPRHWLRVWLHVRVRRCRSCLAEITALRRAFSRERAPGRTVSE